jgi:two-component system cell cycle response regulator DivK
MERKAESETETVVLIVDDFEDNRTMYAEFFRFSGYEVIEASNGVEAIEKATAFVPDVVIMDLSLPVLDGWEATRRLKGDPRTRHIPVLVLTGHAFEEHSKEAQEAGCDRFLAKPCLPETLLETVRQVLAHSGKIIRAPREDPSRSS